MRKGHVVSWDVTDEDRALISQIVARAFVGDGRTGRSLSEERLRLTMDITAVHANGCPLRLKELLMADEFNFWHDINGIERFVDRTTGRLGGSFLPRFSRGEVTRA